MTCEATVKVVKRGRSTASTTPTRTGPLVTPLSATLTGNEGPDTFGTVYTGYTEGEQVTIGEVEPITMPAGCVNVASGDLGTKTLARGANVFTITNTVTCGATVKVVKAWEINGVDYTDGNKPAGYSATLTLDGVEKVFGTEYSGYKQGDSVTVGETKVVVPEGCENVPSGDLGQKTLVKGPNVFTVTNTVTCGASLKVDKFWVVNGVGYDHGEQPAGYTATLSLDEAAGLSFGTVFDTYQQGDTVSTNEAVSVPEGCVNEKSGDLGPKQLDKGLNTFSITNTVTCGATVKVNKVWKINHADPVSTPPAGYSATLTLDGAEKAFGTKYSGYVEGDTVTVGETKVVVPEGCENVASGDLGRKTLAKGSNVYTITNTVTCGASVKVAKAWTINGVDYTNENKPAGYSATLTFEGVEKSFGKEYSGYVEGEYLAIGETKVEVPDGCTNVATGDLGTKILAKGLNTFTIKNTVTCGATVKVVKAWTINGTAYAHGTQPQGYSAQLTLSGKAGSFGETYGGYVEGDQVTIGEDVAVPQGCVNVKSGDLGTKTLARGANVFTVLNTVRCETPPPPPPPTATVEVLKQDDETGEVLEGAEFQGYTDNGSTVGVLDSRDTSIGSPVLTDAAGVARWTGLTYGSYLVEEVAAPTGYGLPKETVQAVTVDARNAGGVAAWSSSTRPRAR